MFESLAPVISNTIYITVKKKPPIKLQELNWLMSSNNQIVIHQKLHQSTIDIVSSRLHPFPKSAGRISVTT